MQRAQCAACGPCYDFYMRSQPPIEITPELLLRAYACGIFPMAESADDPTLFWVEPRQRGVMPLNSFHVPRRLRRLVAEDAFEIRVDTDFESVIDGCAAPAPGREKTWINGRIRAVYSALFAIGPCHTVEVWREGLLVGGLYGVSLGGAFFGESMFHREANASKVALVHLAARLKSGGFALLDAQFITTHLSQFGAIEIPRRAYLKRLDAAVQIHADFLALQRG